jgi:peptidoglycan hydrolase-like protein with peptidoglycan-binding domain
MPEISSSSSTNVRPLATPAFDRIAQGNGLLRRGENGGSVLDVQKALRAQGAAIHADGVFGPETERAVKSFQRQHGLLVDGVVGQETIDRLREVNTPRNDDRLESAHRGSGQLRAPTEAERNARPSGSVRAADLQGPMPVRSRPTSGENPANRTAVIDRTTQTGARNQMAHGQITVNGNTYQFRSGGHGKGNLPPGDYTITPHLWNRSDRSMNVDGVGYSFAMSDKYDPRVRATRSLLRIHPDGGRAGTLGCIGIVGNGDVQRRFREDMRAELQRNGGRFTLAVR